MFADRRDAGKSLIEPLRPFAPGAVLLALPRGGLPVAVEVAQAFGLPLDLMLVRKIGLPAHEELAVGAVAGPSGEAIVVNREVAAIRGLDDTQIAALAAPQRDEIARRRTLYLGDRAPPELAGKTVILIDDGAATGATMRAAIRAARMAKPARVVVALPVASREAMALFRAEADAVICSEVPDLLYAVGAHYAQFPQVSDEEVRAILSARPSVPPDM